MTANKTPEPQAKGPAPETWKMMRIWLPYHKCEDVKHALAHCLAHQEPWITASETGVILPKEGSYMFSIACVPVSVALLFEVPVPATLVNECIIAIKHALGSGDPRQEIRFEPLEAAYDIGTGEPLVC